MARIGVNVNTRACIILDNYSIPDLLQMGVMAENEGYDSVWVGDSVVSKARLEPFTTLAAIAAMTKKVTLGTSCLISPLRHPLHVAHAWANVDQISRGRAYLSVCLGAATPDFPLSKEYETLNVPYKKRAKLMEEGIEIMRRIWTQDNVAYQGNYRFDGISMPKPFQKQPPILIASWPFGRPPGMENVPVDAKLINGILRRLAKLADGWMTATFCRADQFKESWNTVQAMLKENGRDPSKFDTVYQVSVNINTKNPQQARVDGETFLKKYYLRTIKLEDWGSFGTADDCIKYYEKFIDAGMKHFVTRFAGTNQYEQFQRFTKEVLPSFK